MMADFFIFDFAARQVASVNKAGFYNGEVFMFFL